MDRRKFIQSTAATILAGRYTSASALAGNAAAFKLNTTASDTNIVGPDFPATKVWTFGGTVPGSPIRIKHGQAVDVEVANGLDVATSVHWHGIRLPNEMDGVAGLTQAPIEPGGTFRYQFTPPDAGTFWYHSHINAHEQVGRGLYGPLIIEEESPPVVDRELVWMIDDWRLLEDASISEDFGNGHDKSHAGRIGNVPTVNGRFRDIVKVRSGERIRVRLINASNARNFALSFGELSPSVIAIDGQPVTPYQTAEPIVIGAAGRVDVMIDLHGEPGSQMSVVDNFYRQPFDLIKLVFEKTAVRKQSSELPIALAEPTLPEPDLENSLSQSVIIGGGAMGGLQRAKLDGQWMDLREIAGKGYVWALNDEVGNKLDMSPLLDLKQGQSVRLTIKNDSAFPHPMHLHGHHMKLLSIDNKKLTEPRWVDSPLLMPRQEMEFAFVADNPGKWLFHCHVLEHHAAGLGALIRVRA